jgi:hypothetical protein
LSFNTYLYTNCVSSLNSVSLCAGRFFVAEFRHEFSSFRKKN